MLEALLPVALPNGTESPGPRSVQESAGLPRGPWPLTGPGNLDIGGQFTTAGTNVASCIAQALLSESSYNLSLVNLGAGTNVITGMGTPGYSYALDLASSLTPPVNWMPQATNTPVSQYLIYTNVSPYPQGFYRTRYVPQN